jgi:hypothetical protein
VYFSGLKEDTVARNYVPVQPKVILRYGKTDVTEII